MCYRSVYLTNKEFHKLLKILQDSPHLFLLEYFLSVFEEEL